MKTVLYSIKPKYCELIASGKKTVEVRKTRPKLNPPFKCYIYETKGKLRYCNTCTDNNCEKWYGEGLSCYEGKGKVIGEFVCDEIEYVKMPKDLPKEFLKVSCLTGTEICDYLGGCVFKDFYGLHISDLKIYDKPKEPGEFYKLCGNVAYTIKRPPQSWMYVEELKER